MCGVESVGCDIVPRELRSHWRRFVIIQRVVQAVPHVLAPFFIRLTVVAWLAAIASSSVAQVIITEIMVDTLSDEAAWEWIEIRNISGSTVDFDGWVFDDDDDNDFFAANVSNVNGNTQVPAGAVAVLYNGLRLNNDPARFTNAWGSGISLIPFMPNSTGGSQNFVALGNDGDAFGLWSSHENYLLDSIPLENRPPARSFANAVVSVDFSPLNGYPLVESGSSLAWSGEGSAADPLNWVSSFPGERNAVVSVPTLMQSQTAINNTLDVGSPGIAAPASGVIPSKLLITEIMYDPRSIQGVNNEAPFEWIEIYNNTGAPIDFTNTPYVIDDLQDAQILEANINSGGIGQGETAVLFNVNNTLPLTQTDMHAIWGNTINFIPVSRMTNLGNEADTIAIWSSQAAYDADAIESTSTPRRTTDSAITVLSYDELAGWENSGNGGGSIDLTDLSLSSTDPANWAISEAGVNTAFNAAPLLMLQDDHVGGDIGSPGTVFLIGDYNGDGFVNAADYTVWRNNLNSEVTLLNEDPTATPGVVTIEDYLVWKANYGQPAGSGSAALTDASVPEPGSVFLWAAAVGVSIVISRRRSPQALR
jgi:Lamin Tail Domain